MEELVDSVGELTGVGPITKLIKLIINKASTARKQSRICRKFARWLEMMEALLKPLLKVPKLMEHPETRAPLKQLEESLGQAYQLVTKYKDRSYPYRFIMGSDIAERFDDMRNDIKDCIDLIPLITLFVDQTIHRVDTRSQDKEEEMGHNKGEEMGHNNGKNKEEGNNMERKMGQKKGKEERDGDKQRGKEKNTVQGSKEKVTEKKNGHAPLLAKTTVLEVAMRCECDGCPRRIDHSVRKYPGVESMAMEVDKGVAIVTVVGHLDGMMLRDYVAKDTKKEVHLLGNGNDNGGRDREEDHQHQLVLNKTDYSKSIGDGGKPRNNGGKKQRVVPMMVAATVVVLEVGDTGLRCECNGCVDKIRDTLFKITGVQKVGIDTDKNQVAVTGTNMDIHNLQERLSSKVRRPVEVMQMQPGKD